MTDKERLEAVKSRIESMYAEIMTRPQFYCRIGSIEAFVLAIEQLLNIIVGPDRDDHYMAYLSQHGFGMHLFESKYELEKDCMHTFVHRQNDNVEQTLLFDYVERFKKNWEQFLRWRVERLGPASTAVLDKPGGS